MSLNTLEEAIIFATNAHHGQKRKMSLIPYILHPLEVASIIGTMTNDIEVMAAGILHDTVEDCGVDPRTIREKFGPKVAALVASETEDNLDKLPPEATWQRRKEETLMILQNTQELNVKILWLGDKLSNIRSFYREYLTRGDSFWNFLHQKDPKMQYWYYSKIAEYTKELETTFAYKEYMDILNKLFGGYINGN